MTQVRLTTLAILFAEKELARDLLEFNEIVIYKFSAQKNKEWSLFLNTGLID